MPLKNAADFPNGDITKDYCLHCANADGSMKSFEQKLDSMTEFVMKTQGIDKTVAERSTREMLLKLPAWNNQL